MTDKSDLWACSRERKKGRVVPTFKLVGCLLMPCFIVMRANDRAGFFEDKSGSRA